MGLKLNTILINKTNNLGKRKKKKKESHLTEIEENTLRQEQPIAQIQEGKDGLGSGWASHETAPGRLVPAMKQM